VLAGLYVNVVVVSAAQAARLLHS